MILVGINRDYISTGIGLRMKVVVCTRNHKVVKCFRLPLMHHSHFPRVSSYDEGPRSEVITECRGVFNNLINNHMKSKIYNRINSILDLGYKIAIIGWFFIELYYFVNNI